jgi:hypothetical protein
VEKGISILFDWKTTICVHYPKRNLYIRLFVPFLSPTYLGKLVDGKE